MSPSAVIILALIRGLSPGSHSAFVNPTSTEMPDHRKHCALLYFGGVYELADGTFWLEDGDEVCGPVKLVITRKKIKELFDGRKK